MAHLDAFQGLAFQTRLGCDQQTSTLERRHETWW